jgi:hypothetical protein
MAPTANLMRDLALERATLGDCELRTLSLERLHLRAHPHVGCGMLWRADCAIPKVLGQVPHVRKRRRLGESRATGVVVLAQDRCRERIMHTEREQRRDDEERR